MDVATIAAAGAAVVVALSLVAGESQTSIQTLRSPEPVSGWKSLAGSGHRLGAEGAALTIIEFGDYECGACRRFHTIAKELLAAHPNEISFIYKHWPLQQHLYAYDAARAAECAAEQGRFWEYHDKLFSEPRWINDAFAKFAVGAGVPDVASFHVCLNSAKVDARINADIEAAVAVGGTGTPTVIVNGMLQPRPPTAAELQEMLVQASAR